MADYTDGVIIAHDKGLVYGALLVDDWPEYAKRWLKHRPRGLVIMQENENNVDFAHPNIVRYENTIS